MRPHPYKQDTAANCSPASVPALSDGREVSGAVQHVLLSCTNAGPSYWPYLKQLSAALARLYSACCTHPRPRLTESLPGTAIEGLPMVEIQRNLA